MDKPSKKRLSFLVRGICFLLGACLLFTGLSALLGDKTSRKYTGYFYESGDPFEVLFFGSSHMFNGVLPLELYRQTGLFSYNLGMTNEYPSVTYWRMVDALDRCTPKVVVVDVYRALSGEKMPKTESDLGLLHNSLDGMPLSLTKVRATMDILDALPANYDGMFNYLFPLAQFHSRYRSLDEDDYHPYLMETRGAMPLRVWQAGQPLPLDEVPPDRVQPLDSEPGEEYLRRMMELCAGRDIPVVLVALPFQAPAEEMARLNSVAALAAEYPGATWLNLLYEDIINPQTDFSDADGHLNTAGASKVTAWLGQWLAQHFALTDRRGSPEAESWDQSLANVRRQHASTLSDTQDLTTALMLLVGQDMPFTLKVAPNTPLSPADDSLLAELGVPHTPGEGITYAAPGAPESYAGGATGIVAFDPDTGEELARVELG